MAEIVGYKVYVKGNFAYATQILDDETLGFRATGFAKDCKIVKTTEDATSFVFRGFDNLPQTEKVDFENIFDVNQEAWENQAAFETWFEANLGKSSAGDSATNIVDGQNTTVNGDGSEDNPFSIDVPDMGGSFIPADHDLDEFQNAGSDPYARQSDLPTPVPVKKEFVMYIGGQDATGFLNTNIRVNDFSTPFTFIHLSMGVFNCPEFDPTIHFLTYGGALAGYVLKYNHTLLKLVTAVPLGGEDYDASDSMFMEGGFIKIEEYPIVTP